MSDFERVSQPELIAAYRKLIEARASCKTDEEREAAQYELTQFIKYLAAGRLQEWFSSRTTTS